MTTLQGINMGFGMKSGWLIKSLYTLYVHYAYRVLLQV